MGSFKPSSTATPDLDVDDGTISVDADNNKVGIGTTSPKTKLTVEGTVTIKEQANAESDTAAYGQIWVKSNAPNDLYFTNDAGNDVRITNGASLAAAASSAAVAADDINAGDGDVTLSTTVGNFTVSSLITASAGMTIPDDTKLLFGSAENGDATIEYDENGTDELRFAGAAVTFEQAVSFDGNVTLGVDANDVTTVAGELTASLGLSIPDDKKIYFGTDKDASVEYDEDGTNELRFGGNAAVTFENAVTFDGDVTLGDAATDVTTVTGQLTASNGLKIDAGNLVVDENATITGQLSASNGLEVTGTLNVGDKIVFDGNITTIASQLTASNGLKVDAGNLVVDESATITGDLSAAAISGTSLQIANKIEADDAGFGGDLGVSGTLTTGQISGSSLQVAGKIECDDAGFGGDLGVSGTLTATTFAAISASNGIEVTGTMNVGDKIVFDGNITTISSQLTASNGLEVTGTLNVGDRIVFDGLSVTLGSDANDVVTVAGELTASLGMSIPDDKKLYFGTGFDSSFEYDEDGTDTLLYAGASIRISDDTKLEFGTDGDATIEYDENGTDELRFAGNAVTFEQAVSFDGNVTLGVDANDVTTVTGELTASLGMLIPDDKKLYFGTGFDASIEYDEDGDDKLAIVAPAGGALVTGQLEITQGSSGGKSGILVIDNDDTDKVAVIVEAANIDADVIDITADSITSANVIDITAESLTSGKVLNILCASGDLNGGNLIYAEYDGTSTNTQAIVKLVNDNATATATIPIDIQQDAAHPAPAMRYNGPLIGVMVLNSVNTNGNLTITVAQLIDAALARGTNNALDATRTDITPTAAQIVAAIPGCIVNQTFKFKYCNFDATDNIVLDLGTGVVDSGGDGTTTYTLTPGQARNFLFRVDNVGGGSEAVTIVPDGPAYSIIS